MRIRIIIASITPLMLGVIIYTIFRDDKYLITIITENLVDESWVRSIKEIMYIDSKHALILIDSLPSCLWVFSATLISKYTKPTSILSTFSLYMIPLLSSIFIETLQYYNFTDGTYDTNDVYFSILGFLLAHIFLIAIKTNETQYFIPYKATCLFYLILILGDVY